MKITAKTSKEQLKSLLRANVKAVKEQDKDLYERIAYADKMIKKDESKVSRKDLVDLAKEVITLLGEKLVVPAPQPVAENSVKKTKPVEKTEEPAPVPEVSESEETAKEEPAEKSEKTEKVDKKSAKKPLGKKKESKGVVTDLEITTNKKAVQMAKMFPQTIEFDDRKFELASDIKSMEDLYTAVVDKQEEFVFAFYWTKRHLRQFPYFSGILGQPKSFKDDLDLASLIHVSEDKVVAYALSVYTEALYTTIPSDFEEEDGIRINNGMEYQIYRAV